VLSENTVQSITGGHATAKRWQQGVGGGISNKEQDSVHVIP
jgi:hypothetical protein